MIITLDPTEQRTLVYAVQCPILMRTELGPKIVPSSILMRTESQNFGRRFDPFWVRKWPVGSEVRSHFRTFVALESNSKNFSDKNLTKISPLIIAQLVTSLVSLSASQHLFNDNPFVYSVSAFEAFRLRSNEMYEAVKVLQKGIRSGDCAQVAVIDVEATMIARAVFSV